MEFQSPDDSLPTINTKPKYSLIGIGLPITEEPSQVSSPKELPLQALSEPDVNLSTHPAPIVQPFFFRTRQCTKRFGCRSAICVNHLVAFC